MIMEQLMREKLLTVKKEMEGFILFHFISLKWNR